MLHNDSQRGPRAVPTALAVAAALAALLAGCGGGGNGAAPAPASDASVSTATPDTAGSTSPTPARISVSGKVLNVGYLADTPVCLDVNGDGACGSGDIATATNAGGEYALSVPASLRGASLLAVVTPGRSSDTAATAAAPVALGSGWTLSALLEPADGATAVTANISPVTTTYYARMRTSGRNRQSTRIAMFTRIHYTTNVDPATGLEQLPLDFDYVAAPPPADATYGTLASRLRALSDWLASPGAHSAHPANAAPALLTQLQTAGVMNAWYNTWTNATATAPGIPVDAARMDALAANNLPAAYIANAAAHYTLPSVAATETRGELTESATIGGYSWLRSGAGLDYVNTLGLALRSGALFQVYQRWAAGTWSPVTVNDAESITLNRNGAVTLVGATDGQQARDITYAAGNRLTYRLPGSGARQSLDVATRRGDNDVINEWVGQQGLSYANYYARSSNTTPAATPATAPGCNTNASATTATAWFSSCVTKLRNDYFAAHGGAGPTGFVDGPGTAARAEYYDRTQLDDRLDIPLSTTCGSGTDAAGAAISLPTVSVLGRAACNWAGSPRNGHTLAELFSAEGVQINSGTRYYGVSSYTASASAPCAATGATSGACVLPAPTAADQGLPVRLTLRLQRTAANATSGTGTLSSDSGAWSTASNTAKTETIAWEISSANPNLVLISYPFRNAGHPRSNTATVSTATVAAGTEAAPVLTAHFTGSIAPNTHTAPNPRKFALLLQDGVFLTGYHYGAGFTEAERYLNKRGIELGIGALQSVIGGLHAAGFQ